MTQGFAEVVRRHWKETTAYLVAGRQPCVTVARDEIRHVRRRFTFVALQDVPAITPVASWFMGVIVCAGDQLGELASWAGRHDADRVHLYLHKDAQARQLAPWRDAELPLVRVDAGFTSWATLHKVLGWDLNVRVYDDHAPK